MTKVDISSKKFMDLLFKPETGLVDPEAKINGVLKPRFGIAPKFNTDAISHIESSLELNPGSVAFSLEQFANNGICVKRERTDKLGAKYVTYHKIDPEFRKARTEVQLRKVDASITDFLKALDEETETM